MEPTLINVRRLFIMDGVISLPVAVSSFFFLPDLPHNTRVFYLNKEVSSDLGVQIHLQGSCI